jgi:hypothetical protein
VMMSDIDGLAAPCQLSAWDGSLTSSESKPRMAGLPHRDRRGHHVRLGPSRHETKSPGASRSWWHIWSEQRVHPEFRQRVWTAVQESAASEGDRDPIYARWVPQQLDRWERVCQGKPPYLVGPNTSHIPIR